MTKIVSLFGNKEEKKEKPIQFVKYVDQESGEVLPSLGVQPKNWENVSLLCERDLGLDLMFAWGDDPNDGCVYLGHWNDGFVEQ